MKKLKDTKIGLLLKEKAPKILDLIGDVLPSSGTMGILKNIISKDPDLTPEEKAELHNRVIELYKLEVADRDSARKREVEIALRAILSRFSRITCPPRQDLPWFYNFAAYSVTELPIRYCTCRPCRSSRVLQS